MTVETRMSGATIVADHDAREFAARLRTAQAAEVDSYSSSDLAAQALADMAAAAATIARCAERMTTCKPRARFAYASQITKARRKFEWADSTLRGLIR